MRPAYAAHQNSHRSNATFDCMEDQSLTLEQTFARTSKRNFEKGSSFYSHNGGGQQRRPSSASSRFSASNTSYRGGRSHNRFDHSLSYTSHNNELDIVGEEFDSQPPNLNKKPVMYTTPSGSRFILDEDGQAIPTDRYHPAHRGGGEPPSPAFLGRNDVIMEEQGNFHNQQKEQQRRDSSSHPKSPNGKQTNLSPLWFVPPLSKMEPQHIDVSAPSRRCLQQPAPAILVVGSTTATDTTTGTKRFGQIAIQCQNCRTQLYAPKTAIVVRCPLCRTVTSEAACVSMQ